MLCLNRWIRSPQRFYLSHLTRHRTHRRLRYKPSGYRNHHDTSLHLSCIRFPPAVHSTRCRKRLPFPRIYSRVP